MTSSKSIIEQAELLLSQRGERLTPLRRQVFQIISASGDEPLTAYQILERMGDGNKRPAPPTAYRAIDFLIAQGLVHKIHSRSMFIACRNAELPHDAELFICRTCGNASEVARSKGMDGVVEDARGLGFATENVVVEVQGLCRTCQSTPVTHCE